MKIQCFANTLQDFQPNSLVMTNSNLDLNLSISVEFQEFQEKPTKSPTKLDIFSIFKNWRQIFYFLDQSLQQMKIQCFVNTLRDFQPNSLVMTNSNLHLNLSISVEFQKFQGKPTKLSSWIFFVFLKLAPDISFSGSELVAAENIVFCEYSP